MEGVVHLKGDLNLLGDDVLVERTGMRDGHGVEVVYTGGEAGRAGELSTGREGLGEGLVAWHCGHRTALCGLPLLW